MPVETNNAIRQVQRLSLINAADVSSDFRPRSKGFGFSHVRFFNASALRTAVRFPRQQLFESTAELEATGRLFNRRSGIGIGSRIEMR
jgi:hypothetical protein